MSGGTGALGQVGAACFGLAVGYLTCRALVSTIVNAAISVLAAAVGAIGGAAVTGLFAPGTSLFAWQLYRACWRDWCSSSRSSAGSAGFSGSPR